MHLLYHPLEAPNHSELLDLLNEDEAIKAAGDNFRATPRMTPNDPSYAQQWGLETINAPDVWAFTTGGTNFFGDTIVIANLDFGVNITTQTDIHDPTSHGTSVAGILSA